MNIQFPFKANDLVQDRGAFNPNIIYRVISTYIDDQTTRCNLEVYQVNIANIPVLVGDPAMAEYCDDYEVYKVAVKGHPYTTIFRDIK